MGAASNNTSTASRNNRQVRATMATAITADATGSATRQPVPAITAAAAQIEVQGARYPEHLQRLIDR